MIEFWVITTGVDKLLVELIYRCGKIDCCKCYQWLTVDNFSKDNGANHGLYSWCRQCVSEHMKNYLSFDEIKKKRAEYHKKYREENKERLYEYNQTYHQENRDDILERQKKNRFKRKI